MTISKEMLDELLDGCERPEDLLGDAGLMKELKIKLMERMLGAELTANLGYEEGKDAPPGQANRRTAVSHKRYYRAATLSSFRDRDIAHLKFAAASQNVRLFRRFAKRYIMRLRHSSCCGRSQREYRIHREGSPGTFAVLVTKGRFGKHRRPLHRARTGNMRGQVRDLLEISEAVRAF